MSTITGILSVADLQATADNATVLDYGMDTIAEVLQNDLANFNDVVTQQSTYLMDTTTERAARYGASNDGEMYEADEFDAGLAQKSSGGYEVGFPLRSFKRNVGWTMKAIKSMAVVDMLRAYTGIQDGYIRTLYRETQRAFYGSSNYSFTDKFVDNKVIPVKSLLNADSATIPNGPFGETFDGSTHSHYNANATLTNTVVRANITDVLEHTDNASIAIIIAQANAAAFAALDGYIPAALPNIVYSTDVSRGITQLDTGKNNDRLIGYFDGYPVWVKPWAIANYYLVLDMNGERPLKKRVRGGSANQGLYMNSESMLEPLRVEFFEAEFGVGTWRRDAAAVLYVGGGSYVVPTITSNVHL